MAVVDGKQEGGGSGDDSGTPVGARSCPAHWFAGRVHEVLDEVTAGGVHVASISAAETAEAIRELSRATSRIKALEVALLAHGKRVDLAAESGATSTAAWLAAETRTVRGRAHGLVRLASHLDAAFDETVSAFEAGDVNVEQVEVITEAVTTLPRFVDAEDRRRAEAHLLDLARTHDAKR